MNLRQISIISLTFAGILAAAPPPGDDHVPGRLLAQPRLGANPGSVSAAVGNSGARVIKTIDHTNVQVLQVPEPALDQVTAALSKTGLFTFVERDHFLHSASTNPVTPTDPSFPSQWHLPAIQAPYAWGITTGTASVVIAVIDSGADWTHPDLAPNLVTGWNFLYGTSTTQDNAGHGTAVSGTAAAASNNGIGVTGVTWNNKIMPLQVLDANNAATYSNLQSAITYAADHGARIISISLAGSSTSSALQSAIDYAWNKGSVIFAAAGNNASSTPVYPAGCNNVVSVSASDTGGTFAYFSNYGSWIDLAAPGDSILTTSLGGGYGYWAGTSFSAPIAAAVGALVLSVQPGMSASTLVSIMENNADELGGYTSWNQYFGYGQVDAYKSVLAAQSAKGSTTPPSVTISTPTSGSTDSGMVSVKGSATDTLSITSTQFYVDNNLVSSGSSPSYSFSWNTSNYANGSHTVMVKATDTAGNVGSASVPVNVNNTVPISTTPPVVTITKPAVGSTVSGNVSITVSATDAVAISQVSTYIDNVLKCTDTSAPYTCSWNTRKAASGSHTIKATAWDAAGNSASASITVNK